MCQLRLFQAFLALVCLAAVSAAAHAADAPASVVYQWNPASFRSSGPYQGTPIQRQSGATAQSITASGKEWNNYIVVSEGKLKGGHEYTATLKYQIVTPTAFPGTFYMFARSKSLGQHCDIWQTWLGDKGDAGVARLVMQLKPSPANDWTFTVGCKGPATQIIDSFQIVEGSGFAFLPADNVPAPNPQPSTRPVATGASQIIIDPPSPKAEKVLSATDFGLVADAPNTPATTAIATANIAAIKRAIDASREQAASRLVFPKGIYRFHSDEAIPFKQLTDFVIDGQGSEFIFEKLHPNVAAVTVMDCTRVVMKDLSFDWDWSVTPLASLCVVTKVAADGLSCELAFPDLNAAELELVKKAPWMHLFAMDAASLRHTSSQHAACSPSAFETLPGNVLKVTSKKPIALQVGESYCIRHQYYDMSAFRIGDSSHLLFDNVTIYSMPGMGWVSRGEMSHWGLRNCRIARREGSRRPLTTAADGFHVAESLGNLLLENCDFSGCGDDSINIHDNCAQGVKANDEHTLTLVGNPRYRFKVAAGHTIELYRADYSPIGYQSRIESVEYKGNDTILKLADRLPSNLSPQTIVANHHYRTSNVRIANCRFASGRGVLTDACNLTIENCNFDHPFGQGIQLAVDIVPPLWAEGLPTSNIVIRGNRFDGANAAGRVDGAALCTFTRWPAGSTSYPLYRGILIEKNRFLGTGGPAISLRNCANIVVRDNTIDATTLPPITTPDAAAITAAYSSNMNLGGNRWELGASPARAGVLYDPQTTSNIDASGNLAVHP